ncbi:FAD-dependent oxidoreductase [Salinispira pacifica]|uniref:Putative CoA-disulfide reductase n=1 Tax=Salinispira pacifica TaxID=1307761 RepID=V5WF96_9SPIO|nr:FAD-dependent oxidoreductase [Salinispira pacifica]AHC14219.1 Putative CoA-disulfide reductase [Salinispira pacifica]
MKVLIIGGVAGGATTAARLRRIQEDAEIVIFERGGYISYANCGLPYYIGDVIQDRDRLFVQTPESFRENLNIDVRIRSEVTSIDPESKHISVKNLETGEEYRESYDKLVLSPGAEPVKPPIPGIQSEGIFTLRSVPETDAIKTFVEEHNPRKAVIVGAGFIGLEMAENLHEKGLYVTIVEMAQQVMNVVDYEMAAQVHQHLKTKDVEFYLQDGVSNFSRQKGADGQERIIITLQSGRTIETDMVILSIGVRPESRLARDCGIETGETGGIKVNSHLETSEKDIYAVGDAIEFINPITKQPTITYLAGPANKQGRICADNIVFGNQKEYRGSISTAIAKVFDITVASTGASEKTLNKHRIPYHSIITHGSSHAGYYPNAMPVTIKTLFSKDEGRVLGAQIIGYEGVDKRIDMIAAVIRQEGSVQDLMELEHAYAPPYSSAKDPVNIAGFVAENILTGRSRHIHWNEVAAGCNPDEMQLVDVRTPEEYQLGSIDGAVNIPVYEVRSRLGELDRNKTIIVFCGVGLRAYQAERILRQNGFEDVFNLSGGYKTYEYAAQKQSNEDIFENDTIWKDDNIYQVDPDRKSAQPGSAPVSDSVMASAAGIKKMEIDARGLQCPGPIMALKKSVDSASEGQIIRETATDPGFYKDVKSWCNMTGNTLVSLEQDGANIVAEVRKAAARDSAAQNGTAGRSGSNAGNESTMVVFSDSLDQALANFVIANGAASAGKKVTLFFTFWGLSVIKKSRKTRGVKKDFMGKMFSLMLPRGSKKLGLSKMNMAGMGAGMMRRRMKKLNIDSLETMIDQARENGVRMVACQMSMDVMGVKAEELIDGVEIGGVASYLEAASSAGVNLFI